MKRKAAGATIDCRETKRGHHFLISRPFPFHGFIYSKRGANGNAVGFVIYEGLISLE